MDIKIPEVSGHLLNWNIWSFWEDSNCAYTPVPSQNTPEMKCILPFGPTDGPGNNPRHNQLSVIEHFTTIADMPIPAVASNSETPSGTNGRGKPETPKMSMPQIQGPAIMNNSPMKSCKPEFSFGQFLQLSA